MSYVLGKDETKVEQQSFVTNLLLAWLKADLTVTTKRMVGEQPNTLFGIIPLGRKEVTYPLKNISSVGVATKFHFLRFLVGGTLAFIGLNTIGDGSGIIFLALGAAPLLNSYTSTLNITNNSGATTNLEMSILEKDKAKTFANTINRCIADC